MRAVICREFGPRADLSLEEVPAPAAAAGQVVVRVAACGINYFDGLMVEGRYQTRPDRPFSPGAEVAGTIDAVGAGVEELRPGMRVIAFVGHGGYAEAVAVDARRVFPIPASMDFVAAAGFLITYGTAHHALKDRAALKPGETLLVLGAAGGVGLAAVEIGALTGARVIAAASSPEKLELCRRHGAAETIEYSAEDLRRRVEALTDGRGADVVFDPVGGAQTEAALRAIAPGGRHLVIGFASGTIPEIALNRLLLKRAALVGVFWGAHMRADPAACRTAVAELMRWHAESRLRPHISGAYPLERFGEALDLVMERAARGKVILTTGAAPSVAEMRA